MQNIDRRKFIGKTALAGIGLAGAGAILADVKRNQAPEIAGTSTDIKRSTEG